MADISSILASQKKVPWRIVFSHQSLRENQDRMIQDVLNAFDKHNNVILIANNGTGKTSIGIAVALTLLAWGKIKKIYFISRTHRQIAHYFDDFEIINEARKELNLPPLTIVEWASREYLCINNYAIETSEFTKKRNENTIDFACQTMQRHSPGFTEFWCQNGYGTDDHIMIESECQGDEPEVSDIEHLKAYCKFKNICPYKQSRVLGHEYQIVIGTYNYFYDPFLRNVLEIDFTDSLLVCDETHNLPSVIESALKRELTTDMFKTLLDHKRKMLIEVQLFVDNAYKFFELVKDKLLMNGNKSILYDEFGELLTQCDISKFSVKNLEIHLQKMAKDSKCIGIMNPLIAIGSFFSIYTEFSQEAFICYCNVFGHGKYRKYIVGILSLDLAPVMQTFYSNNIPTLFMTGTLEPDLFRPPLGLEENINVKTLAYKGKKRNLQVYLYEKGMNGHLMTSLFEHRKNKDMIIDFGKTIQRLIRHIPNGSIVFFPSYKIKDGIAEKDDDEPINAFSWYHIWKEAGIISELNGKEYFRASDPTCEPADQLIPLFNDKGDDNSTSTITAYKECAMKQKAVLFACFRSRASEGEDFPDQQARGIFILGFPLADISQASIKRKIEYYNNKKRNYGKLWHTLDAIFAVNQGCGRIIRDPESDYGTIHIFESRFIADLEIYNRLSDWIRECVMPNVKQHSPAYAIPLLKQFYNNMENKYHK